MARNRLYKKLPGAGRSFLSIVTNQLFLGQDHLLKVESTRVSEKYRRFYFSDIQGLSVQKTRGAAVATGMLLLIAALVAAGALAAREEPGEMYALAGVAGFFLIIGLVNLVFGPSCRTKLFTAVSSEDLPSINRLRSARQVVRRLAPMIEAAQGGALDPAQYEFGTEAFDSSLPPPGRPGWPVSLFFATVLFLAATLSLDIFADAVVLTLLQIGLLMGGVVLAILSLIQAYQRRVRPGLWRALWLGGAFCGLVVLLQYALAIYVQVQSIGTFGTNLDSLRRLSEVSAQEHAWLSGLLLGLAALGFLAGAIGFYYVRPVATVERDTPA